MPPLPSTHGNATFTSQQPTDIGGMISTIVFGLAACVIGAITIWQGYKAWIIWRHHGAPAGLPNEHGLSLTNVEIGPLPPSHNDTLTPHSTHEERLDTDGDENPIAPNNDGGQHVATTGEGSPVPGTISHQIHAAQGSAGEERRTGQVVATGEA